MNRIWALAVGAALLGGSPLAIPAAADDGGGAGDAVVLHWNEVAVQAVGATPPFPSTRAMATVQLAVFEAVNAITHRYTPYLAPLTAPAGASPEAAAVAAAHDTLVWLFPGQQAFLDGRQAESMAAMPDGRARDDGVAVGRAAAAAVIAKPGPAPPPARTARHAAAALPDDPRRSAGAARRPRTWTTGAALRRAQPAE